MDPIDAINAVAPTTQQATDDAFGLAFEDLLNIVLTQLTFQDPLKPIENFEFVSQLAQFSQIQQTQTMSDRMLALVQAEGTMQATSLLGRTIDVPQLGSSGIITGRVTSVSFRNGEPRITLVQTSGINAGSSVSDINLTNILEVR